MTMSSAGAVPTYPTIPHTASRVAASAGRGPHLKCVEGQAAEQPLGGGDERLDVEHPPHQAPPAGPEAAVVDLAMPDGGAATEDLGDVARGPVDRPLVDPA